jgi:hypothetical protein
MLNINSILCYDPVNVTVIILNALLFVLQAIDDRTIGHNPERLSLLKGGIVYSNAVT